MRLARRRSNAATATIGGRSNSKSPKTTAFSYRDVTPDMAAWYEALLAQLAALFTTYRTNHPAQQAWPLEQQYARWWFHRGPTGFRTTADAFRLRRELLDYIKGTLSEGGDHVRRTDDTAETGV